MQRTGKIAKVVTKIKLSEQKSDFAYWQSQPPIARLEALEQIRQEYHRWKYGGETRMQKNLTVLRMKNDNS
jgi:hypothetical protein